MSMADERENQRAGIRLTVIGRIETPFVEAAGTPIQPCYAEGAEGRVVVDGPFAGALEDIEGFERIWLVYWMDRVGPFAARVVPYRDTREHGLFATRSPCRPNPIGLSAVRLLGREGRTLRVADVDMLDGTPLLEIKPYVPEFDAWPASRAGWFDETRLDRKVADQRFHEAAPSTFEVLSDGSLILDLGRVCIQTAARQAHRGIVQALLEGRAAPAAAESLVDTLARFLETTDFARLRAEHPELAGGVPCRVRLLSDPKGVVRWEAVAAR